MAIRTIRIAEWNANGLLNHKLELIQFLQDNKIDVLLVSETHFTDRTVLKVPNY
jgi:exonuclease III